uniref:Ubiquitin-like domain-containing protein n=1 Tax=Neogobius melanostomus TaxID=47308 RepID=A0A8C6V1K0_9GOBI
MLFKVFVISPMGERFDVDLCNTEEQFRRLTVKDLKRKILLHLLPNTEDTVRLVFAHESLHDESKLLSDYGIQRMSVIQTILSLSGGGGPLPEEKEDQKGNMGDRDGKNISMPCLKDFQKKY